MDAAELTPALVLTAVDIMIMVDRLDSRLCWVLRSGLLSDLLAEEPSLTPEWMARFQHNGSVDKKMKHFEIFPNEF